MDLTRLQDLAISDRGFVLDPHTGATFTVNPAGLSILRGLQAGLGREELVSRLAEEFENHGADLERDVVEYVGLLRQHGLLPKSFQG